MGTKNLRGTVSVERVNKYIRLRWRFQKKRYCLNLFGYNKANLLRAKKIAVQIENDMASGSFDITVRRYKPLAAQEVEAVEKSIVEHFEEWVRTYRNMDCEKDKDYNATRNMMKRWGEFNVGDVVNRMKQETFGSRIYNRRLTLLNAFFLWAERNKIVPENPLTDVLPKKVQRSEKADRKPFTVEEIRLILTAFKNDTFNLANGGYKHSHYYPFIYFLFQTGVRNGEAVGLRVQHIDLKKNLIHIKESLARTLKGTNDAARIRKDTKNGKHRVLPLPEDLKELLMPLIAGKDEDDLVFMSPTGKAIDDKMFQRRIFKKVLHHLGIPHRVLYACRHTFGSRLINSGVNPVTTAFLMGNSPETALRHYTHLTILPDSLPSL